MVAPPSTQGAAFHPPLLRPGEGGRPPVPRGTGVGPSLPGQEAGRWSCHRRFVRTHTRRIRRRRATGSRRPDCPRRVGVANQGDTHSRVVPTGRGSRATLGREGTAGNRGVGLAFDKTGIALPANLSLTCAPRRADGGRAEVARQAKLYANGMRSRIGSRASTRIRSPIELSPPVSAR